MNPALPVSRHPLMPAATEETQRAAEQRGKAASARPDPQAMFEEPENRACATRRSVKERAFLYYAPSWLESFFLCAPIAPDAAARRKRRNLGHSMWLRARHAAACRRPSRMALSLRIVRSNSSA